MGGLIQPHPTAEADHSKLRPVLIGVFIVAVVVGILVLVFRNEQKQTTPPPAYAAYLQFSELKASAAENFAGGWHGYQPW